jgi:PAS domain S-box-containing protein
MQSNQRPGLIMIIAALLVMSSMGYLLFDYERSNRTELARAQGIDLVRLLGGMSWQQLVPAADQKSYLEVLKRGQSNADFAYGAIVDVDGRITSEVTRSGVIIPLAAIEAAPANWLGQRSLAAATGNPRFIESHGPVFQDGKHMGFVRLGYFEPGISFGYQDMPFLATLMLPIFLLVPLFYFLMRQEIKPLRKISESFDKLADQAGVNPVELQPTPELSDFMTQFSGYIEATQKRIETMNQQHKDLEISGKLLTYRNNRIDAILQNFPDAIMVIDEVGEVSYVNGKTHRLLGVESGQMMGKKTREWCEIPEIIPLLTFGDVKTNLQANQNTVDIHAEGESVKSLQFNVYPLFVPNDESRILGRLVVIRDVTENQLIRQRQNEFISHISHELKTPLNVLSMYSESLLTEGADNEEYRVEAVNVIHDEVERLSTLINNLLAINQYELGGVVAQRNNVRMHELLQDTFNAFAKAKNYQGLDFELDIPHEMSMVYIDKDLFRIALNNLMTNAIKYNKPGGRVTMSASEERDSIEIVVADEGYGIAAEDGKQIFNKFFRSTDENIRRQVGHGLGLSLAKQIVSMHHGDLDFESVPGEETRFFIRLEKTAAQVVDAEAS